jgi:hypothetical protein
LDRGGVVDWVLGGWNVGTAWELESGTSFSVTFASNSNRCLTEAVCRPDILVANDKAKTANWSIGPDRFPTSAQNPFVQGSALAYPAAFTVGTLGKNTFTGPAMRPFEQG